MNSISQNARCGPSARAIAVVKFLISRGIPANRLVAAGFGENRERKTGETLRIPLAELANEAFALVGKKKAECAP